MGLPVGTKLGAMLVNCKLTKCPFPNNGRDEEPFQEDGISKPSRLLPWKELVTWLSFL